MKKSRNIALLLLLFAVLGGFACVVLRQRGPVYHGRPITAWLDDFAAHKPTDYAGAIHAAGTNVLPYAVRSMLQNESSWRSNYLAWRPKFPKPLQKFLPEPKPLFQDVDCANVFFYLGPDAIPQGIALLKHERPIVRQAAAWGLGSIRRKSSAANQAIPALTAALNDENEKVRYHAVLALREMGADASNAVPAITGMLEDTGVGAQTNSFFYLRAAAACALGKIGPSAISAVPALKSALHEPNSYLRGQTAVAIWRISSDVDTTLPVLLRDMPGTSEHSKWDWIIALGEMGPRAREAIPRLMKELEEDQAKWVLEYCHQRPETNRP